MDPTEHLHWLRVEGAALLAACRAEPDAPVPACPGWDRAALLAHTAGVHAWHRAALAEGPDGTDSVAMPDVPEGDAVFDWYETGLADLLAALPQVDPHTTWATWTGPRQGTFFARRLAQETAVHRWDAHPMPLDPALAADGVDEQLEVFAPLFPMTDLGAQPATIHLHATDDGLGDAGEWLITLGPGGITYEHGHAKGDVALRGSASDLLLWVWNRVPVDDRFAVFGDEAPLQTWRSAVVV